MIIPEIQNHQILQIDGQPLCLSANGGGIDSMHEMLDVLLIITLEEMYSCKKKLLVIK